MRPQDLLGEQSKGLKIFQAQIDSSETKETTLVSLFPQAVAPKRPSASSGGGAQMQIPRHKICWFWFYKPWMGPGNLQEVSDL